MLILILPALVLPKKPKPLCAHLLNSVVAMRSRLQSQVVQALIALPISAFYVIHKVVCGTADMLEATRSIVGIPMATFPASVSLQRIAGILEMECVCIVT
jgi:hypothetical protein